MSAATEAGRYPTRGRDGGEAGGRREQDSRQREQRVRQSQPEAQLGAAGRSEYLAAGQVQRVRDARERQIWSGTAASLQAVPNKEAISGSATSARPANDGRQSSEVSCSVIALASRRMPGSACSRESTARQRSQTTKEVSILTVKISRFPTKYSPIACALRKKPRIPC